MELRNAAPARATIPLPASAKVTRRLSVSAAGNPAASDEVELPRVIGFLRVNPGQLRWTMARVCFSQPAECWLAAVKRSEDVPSEIDALGAIARLPTMLGTTSVLVGMLCAECHPDTCFEVVKLLCSINASRDLSTEVRNSALLGVTQGIDAFSRWRADPIAERSRMCLGRAMGLAAGQGEWNGVWKTILAHCQDASWGDPLLLAAVEAFARPPQNITEYRQVLWDRIKLDRVLPSEGQRTTAAALRSLVMSPPNVDKFLNPVQNVVGTVGESEKQGQVHHILAPSWGSLGAAPSACVVAAKRRRTQRQASSTEKPREKVDREAQPRHFPNSRGVRAAACCASVTQGLAGVTLHSLHEALFAIESHTGVPDCADAQSTRSAGCLADEGEKLQRAIWASEVLLKLKRPNQDWKKLKDCLHKAAQGDAHIRAAMWPALASALGPIFAEIFECSRFTRARKGTVERTPGLYGAAPPEVWAFVPSLELTTRAETKR